MTGWFLVGLIVIAVAAYLLGERFPEDVSAVPRDACDHLP
jgi:hypothetical protein